MTRTWLKLGNILLDPETIESVNLRSRNGLLNESTDNVVIFYRSGYHDVFKGPAADALRAYFARGPLAFPAVEVREGEFIIDLIPAPAATTEATP